MPNVIKGCTTARLHELLKLQKEYEKILQRTFGRKVLDSPVQMNGYQIHRTFNESSLFQKTCCSLKCFIGIIELPEEESSPSEGGYLYKERTAVFWHRQKLP